ncbi:MAG: APC family permease [Candidatus Gastranaerophilaceae bacterium]
MKIDIKQISRNLAKRRSMDELIATSKRSELKKTLNVFDLIVIGIGAVVGTGIFTIIGTAITGSSESAGAGPAIVISMVLAAIACIVPALCYSEIAAMIPVAGSAYTYTYATMGEFMAWMVGWILMLEYAIGNITVASAWSGYFIHFLSGFKSILPAWICNFPIWLRYDYKTMSEMCKAYGWDIHDKIPYLFGHIPISINVPAIVIVIILTLLLVRGVKESTKVATIMVGVNMFMILSFIIVGSHYVVPENWLPFIPVEHAFQGIMMGAFLIFFAYVGFDAISTTAEETENPQRDLPIAILGTLIICTILYVCVALVLTGIVPVNMINVNAPIADAMSHIGAKWNWFAKFIAIGALCALTSVLLIYQLGTTRILYAISRDRFLPKSWRLIHKKYKTPHVMTWISGIVVIVCGLFMDLNISAALCNFGTFTSFVIICIAVLILRKTNPNRPRPFRVPFCPYLPLIGIFICAILIIFSLKTLKTSSVYFALWLFIGVLIYALYGYHQKRIEERGRIIKKQ